MECSKCDRDAVMQAAYSGLHLCESHFLASVERRVRKRIRKDSLIGSTATPENPEQWVIGLSGGKDSAVLTHLIHKTFKDDPRINIVALTIHEGIEGYRDKSVDACDELIDQTGIHHEIVTYSDEFGIEMDNVVEKDPENMAACAYCGVFRRDILERYASNMGASKLLTGHNLDDEAQTALMNLFEGDVAQMAKHYEASLRPIPERKPSTFVPRAKPLRDIPEKEVALYAHLKDLPAHITECPHASEAYRGEIQQLLFNLEDNHPGTRHSILAGYTELAELAASRYKSDTTESLGTCQECGATTTQEVCRKCTLVNELVG